jgi:phosphoserine phosphatase RsbU/P
VNFHRWRAFWRMTTLLDRAATGLFVLCLLLWLTPLGRFIPFSGGWRTILLIVSGIYLVVRFARWVRKRMLWGLRNRLIVAYIFMAVVPVILLLTMAALLSYLLFFQLGAHLLRDDLNERVDDVTHVGAALEAAIVDNSAKGIPLNSQVELSQPGVSAILSSVKTRLPGLEFYVVAASHAQDSDGASSGNFSGLVQSGGKLWIQATVPGRAFGSNLETIIRVPMTPQLLDGMAPDLGPIQLTTFRPAEKSDAAQDILVFNGRQLVRLRQTSGHRELQPRRGWYDIEITGGSTLDAEMLNKDDSVAGIVPVVAAFSVRPAQLYNRLFTSLGLLGDPLIIIFILIGIFFLALEVAALITGIVLTRTITMAVDDLYEATRHVRQGDFRHRIHVREKDQLGVLADSFNAMTGSIAELIEEQRQRQRLENEITIAREVQDQLFPKELPSFPGLELAAICRAARTVSGDYYDFIKLGPDRLGFVIADISGKGISAALLMASLQAALRSQAILNGHRPTGQVVATLNRHLYLNTSDDRYATLFYAEYDAARRTLRYTNAGHVAPFFVVGSTVTKLSDGGTVVGLFETADYSELTIPTEPGALFVGFSDGLLEPENVYGEEFGSSRLAAEVLRYRDAPVERLAENLLSAVEQWAGTAEQADDMTVIVARFR